MRKFRSKLLGMSLFLQSWRRKGSVQNLFKAAKRWKVMSSGGSGGDEVVGSILGEFSDDDEVLPRGHDVFPRFESTNTWKGQEGGLVADLLGTNQMGL